jgi:hypothetical protein
MICNSGFFFSVETMNCRNGSKSSTTNTRIDDNQDTTLCQVGLMAINSALQEKLSIAQQWEHLAHPCRPRQFGMPWMHRALFEGMLKAGRGGRLSAF